MSAKHTPGPWTHVTQPRPNGGAPGEIVEADGDLIGEFHGADKSNAANARLAAAAPELLEACKAALKEAETWIHDQLDGTSFLDGALAELQPVRDAIARAEGSA